MDDGNDRSALDDPVDTGRLITLVELLDADNEHLRQRNLLVLRWMEEAVTTQVAGERRIADLEERNRALEVELDAIHRSVTWRTLLPIRSLYARIRRRGGTS